jgi:hypothetical protein
MRGGALAVVLSAAALGCVQPGGAASPATPRPRQTLRRADASLVLDDTAPSVEPRSGPVPPDVVPEAPYPFARLPLVSKVMFYTREYYVDKTRFDWRRGLLSALDYVQHDVPEVLVERWPGAGRPAITIRVNGKTRTFDTQSVTQPWSFRVRLEEIFRFVHANLLPLPPDEDGPRLVQIEVAAANGMLSALDSNSVLVDRTMVRKLPRASDSADRNVLVRLLDPPAAAGSPTPRIGHIQCRLLDRGTTGAVKQALATLQRERATGIILDLRGNSGGLYAEAVTVADAFIKSGLLVSMVDDKGTSKDESATDDGIEPTVPLAVLVDDRTASGAEIIVGAIKDLDRGVVIGVTTTGVGSVQAVFDIRSPLAPPGDAGAASNLWLKLTNASWLTPSGASIQGAGITPDIEVFPMNHPAARRGAGAMMAVPFLDEGHGSSDFALLLARDLLAQARSPQRTELLGGARAFLAGARTQQEGKLMTALRKHGIDWSPGSAAPRDPRVKLTLEVVGTAGLAPAGGSITVRGTATNVGAAVLHRVRAPLTASSPFVDGPELVFGKLEPGASRSRDVVVTIAPDAPSLTDIVRAHAITDGVATAAAAELKLAVRGEPRSTPKPPAVTATAAPVVAEPTVRVAGEIGGGVPRDVFIMVETVGANLPSRKAYYLANKDNLASLPFAADVPVGLGGNLITVNGRDAAGQPASGTRLFVIRTK